ncbi:hypothetical protein Ac2012v2_000049 [Leucoagaricus gongylophorus]
MFLFRIVLSERVVKRMPWPTSELEFLKTKHLVRTFAIAMNPPFPLIYTVGDMARELTVNMSQDIEIMVILVLTESVREEAQTSARPKMCLLTSGTVSKIPYLVILVLIGKHMSFAIGAKLTWMRRSDWNHTADKMKTGPLALIKI